MMLVSFLLFRVGERFALTSQLFLLLGFGFGELLGFLALTLLLSIFWLLFNRFALRFFQTLFWLNNHRGGRRSSGGLLDIVFGGLLIGEFLREGSLLAVSNNWGLSHFFRSFFGRLGGRGSCGGSGFWSFGFEDGLDCDLHEVGEAVGHEALVVDDFEKIAYVNSLGADVLVGRWACQLGEIVVDARKKGTHGEGDGHGQHHVVNSDGRGTRVDGLLIRQVRWDIKVFWRGVRVRLVLRSAVRRRID
jgi:hypothetical protein